MFGGADGGAFYALFDQLAEQKFRSCAAIERQDLPSASRHSRVSVGSVSRINWSMPVPLNVLMVFGKLARGDVWSRGENQTADPGAVGAATTVLQSPR